jgi:membrane protein DedA with SNARE-associated domain
MGLIEQTSFLSEFFGEFSYLAPFVVLVLCGLGLPLPEEVTLIGSGILLYRGEVEFVPIVAVCSAAILIGDSVPYWLGRKYGMSALRIKWVARVLHPERFAKIRRRFEEHGNWATFAARFFAGVRIPGYFVAGTMGMRFGRFLVLDLAGVLLSVPISIYLGRLFGNQIETLESRIQDFHMILAFVAISLVVIVVVRLRRKVARLDTSEVKRMATEDPPPDEG